MGEPSLAKIEVTINLPGYSILVAHKGVGNKKTLKEKEQWKNQDRKISPISFLPFYQWHDRERTRYARRAQPKGTLLKSHM